VIAKAKLFKHGRSQAVRLPKEFRFEGTEVRATKVGKYVILSPDEPPGPMPWDEIDRMFDPSFFAEGREQPPMPEDRVIFDP
jgi:antitoxin VapB